MNNTANSQAGPQAPRTNLDRLIGCHGSDIRVTGCFYAQGPQAVGEGGGPQWVMDAFRANPNLDKLAIVDDASHGVVWSRPAEPLMGKYVTAWPKKKDYALQGWVIDELPLRIKCADGSEYECTGDISVLVDNPPERPLASMP